MAITNTTKQSKNNDDPKLSLRKVDTDFKLTVEPIMFFLLIGLNINMMVQTNLFEERTCRHTLLIENNTVNCNNLTKEEQEIVQPTVVNLKMINTLIETLVPSMTVLFLGPWSDVNGRLPLLISASLGMVISNIMFYVFSLIPSLPPVVFLLCSLPLSLSGGINTINVAAFCYIVDITDVKTRAFRLSILKAFTSFGIIIGSILGPTLYNKSSIYAFTSSFLFAMAGFLYTTIFLKESIEIKKGENERLFNIRLIKDMWQTIKKQRFGYLRCIIVLSSVIRSISFAITFGENVLLYMYLQKQFSWTLETYTLFNVFAIVSSAFTYVIGLYLLSSKLQISDMYIATAAIGFRVIEKICFAYSFDPWQFYLAKFIGSSAVISASLIRSQLSKSLPVEDIGKISAFISVMEGFGKLLGTPMYTVIYNMTIYNNANLIFLLSTVLTTSILGLYIFTGIMDNTNEVNIKYIQLNRIIAVSSLASLVIFYGLRTKYSQHSSHEGHNLSPKVSNVHGAPFLC